LRLIRKSDSLSTVAAETGFADQAHMCRWIRRITGATPGAWRRSQLDVNRPVRVGFAETLEVEGTVR
ncbi:MAG: helix-turn-helix domain-containing protein, partial [Blastocatellia bacterium]